MTRRAIIVTGLLGAAVAAILVLRVIHPPMTIDVSAWFARAIATVGTARPSFDLSAEACGACHTDSHREWTASRHARSWVDPYFQADWAFLGSRRICLNCHTPIDRQQKELTVGARGGDPWDPVLAANPEFDPALQREGVTCVACHVRDGVVHGPNGGLDAPHPTAAWKDPDESCVRCHTARNTSLVAFLRMPPCGTISEIARASGEPPPAATLLDTPFLKDGPPIAAGTLGCVACHMPAVDRPLTPETPVRRGRIHRWAGGHDPETLTAALTLGLSVFPAPSGGTTYGATLTNTGAAHDIPTGAAERRLTVTLQTLDDAGRVLRSEEHELERRIVGAPFVFDLRDTRLRPGVPRSFELTVAAGESAAVVEVIVRYWLTKPRHAARIGYTGPIATELMRRSFVSRRPAAGG